MNGRLILTVAVAIVTCACSNTAAPGQAPTPTHAPTPIETFAAPSPFAPTATASETEPTVRPSATSPDQETPNPAEHPPPYVPGPPAVGVIDIIVEDLGGPHAATILASAAWTGDEAIFWSGWDLSENATRSGISYNPATDSWQQLRDAPIEGRGGAAATWTGTEMLVWGGAQPSGRMALDGAAYSVEDDSWRVIAEAPTTWLRAAAAAWYQLEEWPAHVWTGHEWVIGFKDIGDEEFDVGKFALYDPKLDEWRVLPETPVVRTLPMHLTWTGSRVVLTDYDRVSTLTLDANEWSAEASPPGGLPAYGEPVWTAGGLVAPINRFDRDDPWGFLAEWNEADGSWRDLAQPPTPAYGDLVTTGDYIFPMDATVAYEIAADRWWEMSTPMSSTREEFASLWTGQELIVWGGSPGDHIPDEVIQTGVVFTPSW